MREASQSQASVVHMSSFSPDATLHEIGEGAALAALLPLLPTGDRTRLGPGDDSAVVDMPDSSVLVSSDMMIEGPDFRLDWSTPGDVGFKAIASNAADIAAMGGVVLGYEIAVAVPADTPFHRLSDLARGFAEGILALTPQAGVLGGDLSRAPVMTIAVTVLGSLEGRKPVLRSGARPGDILAVAGEMGLSHQGLEILAGSSADQIPDVAKTSRAVAHHLRPHPPISLGPVAADAGATAMMDISDGLVLDCSRMAAASTVTMVLDVDAGLDHHALTGGEDHGLLATFPAGTPLPDGFRRIGAVTAGPAAVLLGNQKLDPSTGGWDPFSNRAIDTSVSP